jgi:hypothetical protein
MNRAMSAFGTMRTFSRTRRVKSRTDEHLLWFDQSALTAVGRSILGALARAGLTAMSRFSDRGQGPYAPRHYAAATILPARLASFFLSSASGTGGL